MIEAILVTHRPGKPDVAEILLDDDHVDLFGGALDIAAESAERLAGGRPPFYMDPDAEDVREAVAAHERAHFYKIASLRIIDDSETEPMRLRHRAPELYAGLMFGLGRLAVAHQRNVSLVLQQYANQPLDDLLREVSHRILTPDEFRTRAVATEGYDEEAFYREYHYSEVR